MTWLGEALAVIALICGLPLLAAFCAGVVFRKQIDRSFAKHGKAARKLLRQQDTGEW